MRKQDIALIAVALIVIIVIIGGYAIIKSASGVNPPFTVIESESMQHSGQSEIGIIDTGDMVLVKSPEKSNIVTYLSGKDSSHQEFGDYGSVIIYYRAHGNPVIHRAIAWLDYNGDGTWNCSELQKYNEWNCTDSDDCKNLSGTLTIYKTGTVEGTITINLDNLSKHSGYITMGDNNNVCDQNCSISLNNLISKDKIKSVAWKEIPWIGAIKLIFNGHLDSVTSKVPNTIPCLLSFIFTIVLIFISIGMIFDEITLNKRRVQKI